MSQAASITAEATCMQSVVIHRSEVKKKKKKGQQNFYFAECKIDPAPPQFLLVSLMDSFQHFLPSPFFPPKFIRDGIFSVYGITTAIIQSLNMIRQEHIAKATLTTLPL